MLGLKQMKIDLTTICNTLATKYKNYQEKEDLISEGYLAGLEAIEIGEDPYHAARRAMNDYYNIKRKPVSIPRSGAARSIISQMARDNLPNTLEGTDRLLYLALKGDLDEVEATTMRTEEDPTETNYILGDLYKKALDNILTSDMFTVNESFVLYELFYNERSIVDISQDLNVSDKTCATYRDSALEKLKEVLT